MVWLVHERQRDFGEVDQVDFEVPVSGRAFGHPLCDRLVWLLAGVE
jgi:hypothetical protein